PGDHHGTIALSLPASSFSCMGMAARSPGAPAVAGGLASARGRPQLRRQQVVAIPGGAPAVVAGPDVDGSGKWPLRRQRRR
ncbi:unnamed protein product, partial [Urochloa humidicola]